MKLLRDQSELHAGGANCVPPLDRLMSVIARSVVFFAALLCLANISFADDLVAVDGAFGPRLDIGKGGHCVEDPQFMRRNHMKLIIHQRDQTVRLGIRGSKYSLANCVECHASKVNHSVLGSNQNFCQGCHVYAAVKIDCFECHSSKPREFRKTSDVAVEEIK